MLKDSLYRNLGEGYDFKTDPLKVLKIKDFSRHMKQLWQSIGADNQSKALSMPIIGNALKYECARVSPPITVSGDATKNGMKFVDPRAKEQNENRNIPRAVWNKQKYGVVNEALQTKYANPSLLTGRSTLRSGRALRSDWDIPEGFELVPADGSGVGVGPAPTRYIPGSTSMRRKAPASSSSSSSSSTPSFPSPYV
jgi:hypothetical protein